MCNDAPATRGGWRTAGWTAPSTAAARTVTPRDNPPAPAPACGRSSVLAPGRGRRRAPTVPRRPLRLLAAPLLALLAVMLVATPVRAHDVLIASDPKDGAVLDAMPASVTLTFNQVVRRDFARIAVTGPDGAHYEQGEVTVDGKNASIGLRTEAPAGTYAIGYRIVSNDGHPVTGTVKFRVEGAGAAPGTVTESPTPAPSAAATGAANPGDATTGTGTISTGTTGQGGGSWVWGLLAVTAALLALCTRVLVRHDRRLRDGTIPAPTASPRTPSATGSDASGTSGPASPRTAPSGTASSAPAPTDAKSGAASSETSAAGVPETGTDQVATEHSAAGGTGSGSSPATGGAS